MESKTVKVKPNKVEETIAFHNSFGYELTNQEEENGKVVLSFERDKERFEGNSYNTIKANESLYARISRPFPLAAIIMLEASKLRDYLAKSIPEVSLRGY